MFRKFEVVTKTQFLSNIYDKSKILHFDPIINRLCELQKKTLIEYKQTEKSTPIKHTSQVYNYMEDKESIYI